jgi:hypothetical protein
VRFIQSGLADADFMTQFASGDVHQMLSRCWEALLHERFQRQNWGLSSAASGPDFVVDSGMQRAMVEAVALTPGAEAANAVLWDYVNVQAGAAFSVPYDEQLLRWTAAIRSKAERHNGHIASGHADPELPFVIAVNAAGICPDPYMISGLPKALAAVFPAGETEMTVAIATGAQIAPTGIRWRPAIPNHNGTPIPLNAFLSAEYSHVSALIGCSGFCPEPSCGRPLESLPADIVVHNPLAMRPLPRSWLPGAEEWVAHLMVDGSILFEKTA